MIILIHVLGRDIVSISALLSNAVITMEYNCISYLIREPISYTVVFLYWAGGGGGGGGSVGEEID